MPLRATTGVPEVDRLIGGVIPGDNIVWEADSGAPVDVFVSDFIGSCEEDAVPVVYVSFNRSPQSILAKHGSRISKDRFTLVDCFSSGKGNGDRMFLKFFDTPSGGGAVHASLHLENPSDPSKLQEALIQMGSDGQRCARYVFDSLTGMLDLWGSEEHVIRFFGHFCPRLFDLNTLAFWLLEKEAHSVAFLAKLRHITQVVIEIAVSPDGAQTITARKATNRQRADIGVPHRFALEDGSLVMAPESREDRELRLLTRMSDAMPSALDPEAFFNRTMQAVAGELGMVRATLVLLDRTTGRLRIAAAHGLSPAEQARGEYAVGEGITGLVVKTGNPEVVPDISRDPRFLDRTAARKADPSHPTAFICVPLRVDNDVIGALSADRPYAVNATLQKDLRLLTIVAAVVSQVIKINRLAEIEKDIILARDEEALRQIKNLYRMESVVGHSSAIRQVLASAAVAAKSNASILITGETGTGKEMIANVVHYNSARSAGPFVKVNCGALPETLLDSELFGHLKGSFTGALRDRKGRFETADGGTLFLDEIAEMSPRLQVKLLRVLQTMEFEPVGSSRTVKVSVRIVTATNKNLKDEIRAGRFREDLYYRLNVIPIHLPPLRERREDIPLLVDHFLNIYNRANGKNVRKLSRNVLDLLLEYPWPGNIRELENCIERAVVMSPSDVLSPCLLPVEILNHSRASHPDRFAGPHDLDAVRTAISRFCTEATDLGKARESLLHAVEQAVLATATQAGTSQRELARKLGISRGTLRKKISRQNPHRAS